MARTPVINFSEADEGRDQGPRVVTVCTVLTVGVRIINSACKSHQSFRSLHRVAVPGLTSRH
jgi:hypothetical protein